ncbi:MAG: hypothetical protein HY507_02065 [Candidatus Zambryskibacteria bacterium]|nr:hypothetical protein [Candidatus Zambryskibacteria bacterium]
MENVDIIRFLAEKPQAVESEGFVVKIDTVYPGIHVGLLSEVHLHRVSSGSYIKLSLGVNGRQYSFPLPKVAAIFQAGSTDLLEALETLSSKVLESDIEPELQEKLAKSIDELELSVRSYNCFKNADIRTVGELVEKSEENLLAIKNFNHKCLTEVKEILHSYGLAIRS